MLVAVLAAAGALAVAAAPAVAEEQPSILKAYGLDWIQHVREDAWPQPKDRRPVMCLLDTGVAVTPDTPEDNTEGPIVARLALDGGTGLPQGDTWIHHHGTDMASVIAAPRNDWGTVGVFPQARIVSVRVTEGAETYITPRAMLLGTHACTRWAASNDDVRVASVVMAESFYDQRPTDVGTWAGAAAWAREAGALFIAAAGNTEDAQMVAPVASADVVSVGAGDEVGRLCPFALHAPTAVALGPGCASDSRWPAGSSAATAAVGALAGAYATSDPGLSPDQIRTSLTSGRELDPTGAWRFSGKTFGATRFADAVTWEDKPSPPRTPNAVSVAPLGVALSNASPSDPQAFGVSPRTPSASHLEVKLWRPQIRATWNGRRVQVSRTDRWARGRLRVRLDATEYTSHSGRSLSVTLRRRPVRFEAWVEGREGTPWRSLSRRGRVRLR